MDLLLQTNPGDRIFTLMKGWNPTSKKEKSSVTNRLRLSLKHQRGRNYRGCFQPRFPIKPRFFRDATAL